MAGTNEALKDTVAMLGLGTSIKSALDLTPVIRRGLPLSSLESVSERMGLTVLVTIESLGLPKRTLARRIQENQHLTANESERIVRLARVLAHATKVLGSVEKARHWLQTESRALGGERPLKMLDTDIGANAVNDELGRIDHGVFA